MRNSTSKISFKTKDYTSPSVNSMDDPKTRGEYSFNLNILNSSKNGSINFTGRSTSVLKERPLLSPQNMTTDQSPFAMKSHFLSPYKKLEQQQSMFSNQ